MRKSDGGRIALPREIDENLKRAYQARLDEGIPDRFAALLDALRNSEAGQARTGAHAAPEPAKSGNGGSRGSADGSTGGAA